MKIVALIFILKICFKLNNAKFVGYNDGINKVLGRSQHDAGELSN